MDVPEYSEYSSKRIYLGNPIAKWSIVLEMVGGCNSAY